MIRSTIPLSRRLVRPIAAAVIVLATLLATSTPATAAGIREQQWYLDALHIPQAQHLSTGTSVTVAVIDSGVDGTHPDLRGQLTPGTCVEHLNDIQDPDEDLYGHGTAMAGIIAANGGGSDHASGIAPAAKVMPICMETKDIAAGPSFRGMADALRWATDHGATVVNISLGSDAEVMDEYLDALKSAVAYAESHDVVVVAGTGNDGKRDGVITPAKLPGVVAVGGTTKAGTLWPKSNTGKQVALTAPATGIVSTDTRHNPDKPDSTGYRAGTGTSDATAIVSGVAALVRAKYPKLDAANVINRLIRTADHKGAPGRNDKYGYGIVDPVEALTADVPKVQANPLGQQQAPGTSASASSDDQQAGGAGAGSDRGGSALPWVIAAIVVVLLIAIAVAIAASRRRRSTA